MKKITVSIVIPIYNELRTLPALIEGLNNQTYKFHEVVFVDAGSTDGSVELINRYENSVFYKIKLVNNPGGYPGANRNVGILNASGSYIAFIDAGILPKSDWLEELIAHIDVSDCVYGVCDFNAELPFAKAVCASTYGLGAKRRVLPASLFSATAIKSTGLFNSSLRAAEDKIWMSQNLDLYPNSVTVKTAVVYYKYFPVNIIQVIKKWYCYQEHSVKAGLIDIYSLILSFFFITVILFFYNGYYFLTSVFVGAYYFARSIVDPIRRSSYTEIRHQFASLYHLLYVPLIIDSTKVISLWGSLYRKFVLK